VSQQNSDSIPQKSGSFSHTSASIDRLAAAIDRLESAAARIGAGDLLLAGELRQAREENETLRDTTRVVTQRLDGVIDRLRFVLEE